MLIGQFHFDWTSATPFSVTSTPVQTSHNMTELGPNNSDGGRLGPMVTRIWHTEPSFPDWVTNWLQTP